MPDPTSPVLLDPAAAFPEVTTVRAALAARDWTTVRRILDTATPIGRSTLISIGADSDRLEDFLRYVLHTDPNDSAAAAMLGEHLIDVGWTIRTGARAEHVSRQQFDSFHAWLRRAETVLLDGVARNPGDPALWVARLTSARGLGLGVAETRRRYGKLAAIDPHHLPGQIQYLQSLCPKWGGTWEELHAWTRQSMLAAPAGSLQARLVVEAHLERWLDLHGGPPGMAYLRSEAVRQEIYEAAYRSVWHAGFRREYGWVTLASDLAFVFSVLDDRAATASMFGMLGHLGAELPWGYLPDGDAADHLRTHREWALQPQGAHR